MKDPSRIRITGPFKPYIEHVWTELLAQGYTPLSSRDLLYLMAHLSGWLEGNGLQPHELTDARLEAFIVERRRAGHTKHLSRQSLDTILEHLQTAGVVLPSQAQEPAANELDRLLKEYEQYLVEERALVPTTRRCYQSIARRFLTERFGQEGLELNRLSIADVTTYVVRQSRTSNGHGSKYAATALRSVLRYLYLRGDLSSDLTCAVPRVAGWRQASLPRALAPKEVQRLLQRCDRRTHPGRRDFAVLVLLARFGLRASEVAALELDDFDWTRGELVIRGKRREDRLPLPNDVGEAVVAYLRFARPQTTNCRKLFLSCIAPLGEISSTAVRNIVRRASVRAGLSPIGSHRLRHSAATQMLRQGASLSEIAHVLRHRNLDTTAIYAKIDRNALRELAQPWPDGGVR